MCLEDNCGEVSEGRRSFIGGAFGALAASALAAKLFGQQQPPPKPAEPLEPLALKDRNVIQGDFTFKSEGATMNAHLARPKAAGRYAAVVIFPANPGVTDDLRNTAAQLAQGGFVGLAFDPYSRDAPVTASQARERFEYYGSRAFDELTRRDMWAGLAYLRHQPFVRRGTFGVMGFCGGARQALIFSSTRADVGAIVAFYAPPVLGTPFQAPKGPFKLDVMDVFDRIRVPVQVHQGTADPAIPLADVQRLERELKAQGTPAEFYYYEGALHAFYDFTRPRFHPEAAKLAHGRMIQSYRSTSAERAGGEAYDRREALHICSADAA